MTEAKLLELENKFIFLKNHGKGLEEIRQLLPSIDLELLEKWNKSFDEELQKLKENGAANITTIDSKGYDGNFLYKNSISFNVNKLGKLKLDLLSHKFIEPEIEKQKQEYLGFIDKYFVDLDYGLVRSNEKNSSISFAPKLNTNDPNITEKAFEILNFYTERFLKFEYITADKVIINENTPLWFNNFEDVLPFAIKQFKVLDFHGIQNISIETLNTDAKWIFLTGENSFGKSTLLQSIAIALTGEVLEHMDGKRENFAIEIKNSNNSKILNFWDRRNFEPFPHLACYGPSRLLLQTDRSQNEVDEKSSVTYHLFNPDGILLNIEFELFKWFYKKDERYGKVIFIFKQLIPNLKDIVLDEKDDKIYYIEKDGHGRLTFNQLASGYRSLIAMVGDMMIRLFKTQENITNPNDLAGIVLIDELDLHWHPKWQHRLPSILSDIFPNVQFVATTHSAIPLLGAPKHSIFIKVTRNVSEGIKAEKVDIDMTNLLPNHVLTSELFDMDIDEIKAISNVNNQDLRTEDTMSEVKENIAIDKRLEAFEASNALFPDNLFD